MLIFAKLLFLSVVFTAAEAVTLRIRPKAGCQGNPTEQCTNIAANKCCRNNGFPYHSVGSPNLPAGAFLVAKNANGHNLCGRAFDQRQTTCLTPPHSFAAASWRKAPAKRGVDEGTVGSVAPDKIILADGSMFDLESSPREAYLAFRNASSAAEVPEQYRKYEVDPADYP